MELNRRVSSAGYRLPQRSGGTRPPPELRPPDRTRRAAGGDAPSSEPSPDTTDRVRQDRVWTELVHSERRGLKEWEKNWDFLRKYDQMGQLKSEEPLPSSVSLFSDRVPNTTNQMFGSRLSTPLGRELVRQDRLLLWPESHHKRKQDADMLPW